MSLPKIQNLINGRIDNGYSGDHECNKSIFRVKHSILPNPFEKKRSEVIFKFSKLQEQCADRQNKQRIYCSSTTGGEIINHE